jgi:Tfp pilus assembly protein PilV
MNKQQQGYFLVAVVIITLFLTTIGLAIAALTSAQYAHTKRQVSTENAQLVTEAAVEQSVQQLNADDTFGGYTTAQQFFSNTSQGKGTFTLPLTPTGSRKRLLQSARCTERVPTRRRTSRVRLRRLWSARPVAATRCKAVRAALFWAAAPLSPTRRYM